MHLRDPFCIMTYRDFSIFKTAAVCHLGFLKIENFNSRPSRDMFSIVLNLVEIDHTVREILQFFSLFPVKCKDALDDCA